MTMEEVKCPHPYAPIHRMKSISDDGQWRGLAVKVEVQYAKPKGYTINSPLWRRPIVSRMLETKGFIQRLIHPGGGQCLGHER